MLSVKKNKLKYETKCSCCGKKIKKEELIGTLELKASFTKVHICEQCLRKLLKEGKDGLC